MVAPVEAPPAPTSNVAPKRIIGLDVARALAMAGMVLVHYVWPDESGSAIDLVASAMLGRAMPLFVLLGGVGVSLAVGRLAHPDRAMTIRAAILFVLGLALHELSAWVAVILQSYGLLFAIAPLLRRLSDRVLLATAAVVAAAGAWTYQVLGTFPRRSIAFTDLDSPTDVARALLFDGYYPFFPVASFFVLGVWLGRLDLRSDRVAARIAAVGIVVGIGTLLAAGALIDLADIEAARFEVARQEANVTGFDSSRFFWARLLDDRGHGQMPVWVLSAAGTAVATVGASLLVAGRAGRLVDPVVSLGRLALTFYVFQVLLTNAVPFPNTTTFGRELITAALIYFGFMAVAHAWTRFFRAGPFEALLRIGSGAKTAGATGALPREPLSID